MKKLMVLSLALFAVACGKTGSTSTADQDVLINDVPAVSGDPNEIDSDEGVLSPEQEEEFYKTHIPGSSKARTFRFAQTTWLECDDTFTGNYFGFNCTNKRGMAVILKNFLDDHSYKCVNEGLAAQGGGQVADLHIVHAGILGDPNHSPRSMHAENRAIDIKSFEIKLTSGRVRNLVYEGKTNRAFFTAFRRCWGKVVRDFNGCPYFKNDPLLTGSIGWEDSRHQHHLHTSVPFCVNGAYGPYYFRK